MLKYLIQSFKRKLARRITKKYPMHIDTFPITEYGIVKFANWDNPLVEPKSIEQNNIEFFKKFLKEGDVGVDIGANIGNMTIPMAIAAGKSGAILAFDPNPYVCEILNVNAELNPDLTNIQVYNYAISDEDGDFYYTSSEASFNNGGISKEKENRHGKFSLSTKIKGINLEKFLKESHSEMINKIRLIKIDTEGYDKEILRSISGFLDKYKPTVITECFGKTNAETRYEQFELLHSRGYKLYYISDFDVKAEMIPIEKKEDMLKWKHFDLYAVAK